MSKIPIATRTSLVKCSRKKRNQRSDIREHDATDFQATDHTSHFKFEDPFLASWFSKLLGNTAYRPILMLQVQPSNPAPTPGRQPENCNQTLDDVNETSRAILERAGGHVVQRRNQQLVGVWGLTELRLNDPARMIEAAIAIAYQTGAANRPIRCLLHAQTVRVCADDEIATEQNIVMALGDLADISQRASVAPAALLVSEEFRSKCGILGELLPVSLTGCSTEPSTKSLFVTRQTLDHGFALSSDINCRNLLHYEIPKRGTVALTAQLDALGDLKPMVLGAAIAGTPFSIDMLAHVFDIAPYRLAEATKAACLKGIFKRDVRDPDRFEFRDPALHQAAYETIATESRLKLHISAARASRHRKSLEKAAPAAIARHHSSAHNPRQSQRWLSKAAWQAIARNEAAQAVAHLQEAISKNTETTALNRSLCQLLGVQLALTKGNASDEVFNAFQRSIAMVDNRSSLVWGQEFRSLWLAQSCHIVKGEVRAALTIGNLLLIHARKRKEQSEGALGRSILIHRMQGLALMLSGQLEQSIAHYDFVIDNYDADHHAVLRFAYGSDQAALALAHKCWVLTIMGDTEGAADSARRARKVADKLVHPHTTAHVMSVIAVAALTSERYDEAVTAALVARAISIENGFVYWVPWSDVVIAADKVRRSPRGAIDDLEAAMAAYRATGAMQLCPVINCQISGAALMNGQHQIALANADSGLDLVTQNACVLYRPELLLRRAHALFALGSAEAASAALEAGLKEARSMGATLFARRIAQVGLRQTRGREQIVWQQHYHACI